MHIYDEKSNMNMAAAGFALQCHYVARHFIIRAG